ncbi:DUF4349 domain-containing protein [Streptomyces endophyticus]|uniref:DUF4349 domain-containing protein n=1 Tax=Streptomyces endophyticus TaxID=714166 RepID=A0ABU6FG57_9ACTN|nr:DUF4349 domain-containing protein [Streptomyces endophyticus]MEB8343041.1 DUF4349 domain-containing protein [Streptomyces endophyticus]
MHLSGTKTRTWPRRPLALLAAALFALALALTGCSAGGDDGGSKSAADADSKGAAKSDLGAGGGSSGSADQQAKKPPKLTGVHVIRTAHLSVRVKDVPDALDKARTAAEDAGGMVGDETTDRDGHGHERSRVTLRVPQESYEDVLDQLAGSGRLLERNVTAKDVTDQVVDVESRIKSQRASVARVRELMDRAEKLSDVVTLEGELGTRQSELEALLAQQDSLKDRTSLATITLRLTETPSNVTTADDDPGILDALSGGWNAFVTALKWIGIALAAVLPFATLLGVLVYLFIRFVRRNSSPAGD